MFPRTFPGVALTATACLLILSGCQVEHRSPHAAETSEGPGLSEVGSTLTEAELESLKHGVIDSWLARIEATPAMHVDTLVTRFCRLDDDDETDPGREFERYQLRSEAFMGRETLAMMAWEGPNLAPADRPALIVTYADGIAKDRIWSKELDGYVESSWPAEPEEAAATSQYRYGCDIGLMFVSWPGRAAGWNEWMEELLRSGAVELASGEDGDEVIRLTVIREPLMHPGTEEPGYTRTDIFTLSRDGLLRVWRTEVWNALDINGHDGRPYWIVQETAYTTIEFLRELPSEVSALLVDSGR